MVGGFFGVGGGGGGGGSAPAAKKILGEGGGTFGAGDVTSRTTVENTKQNLEEQRIDIYYNFWLKISHKNFH